MAESKKPHRKFITFIPLPVAVLGIGVLYSSTFIFDHVAGRIASVNVGIVLLMAGLWYAAKPFLKNDRKYIELREEATQFINLVKKLNHAATKPGNDVEFERVKGEMHQAVERMAAVADKVIEPRTASSTPTLQSHGAITPG